MIRTFVLVFAAEVFNTLGQVLFKKATNHDGENAGKGIASYASFFSRILRRPDILFGIVSMAAGLVFWLMALDGAELSLVFPLSSMQYIMILAASGLFLKEKIDLARAAGTFLIAGGIVCMVLS